MTCMSFYVPSCVSPEYQVPLSSFHVLLTYGVFSHLSEDVNSTQHTK